MRLERAAQQLAFEDKAVTRVAFDAGYETHESFTRAFGAHFSISPSDFRARENRPVDEVIGEIVTNIETSFDPFAMIQIRALGGAMSRVPNQATAFAHRDKSICLALIDMGVDPENRKWVGELWSKLQPYTSGAYVNFLGDEGEERVHAA